MRGGPFSETRVIELLNRRFVPFYYNTGGPGLGKDPAATAFAKPKVPNQWAFFAAFAPDGAVLGVTEIYAGTDEVFEFLRALLRRHPEYDRDTAEEKALLARGGDAGQPADAAAALAAGRLAEELARHGEARGAYAAVVERGSDSERAAAYRGLLRITRYERDWPAHKAWLAAASGSAAAKELLVDLVLEQGYRLMAHKRFAAARALLQPATRAAGGSSRLAELHYEAGRACWFMDDRDWAKLHWCWILEHLPDDRFAMRASLAAAADVFPYPNHELGGFAAKVGNVGPGVIGKGVAAARKAYARLLPRFTAGDFGQAADDGGSAQPGELAAELTAESRPAVTVLDQPESVVARLGDGADAAGNDRCLELLRKLGDAAVLPLVVAGKNAAFAGRAQVARALGQLLAKDAALPADKKKWALEALQGLAKDRDAKVAEAARASLERLE